MDLAELGIKATTTGVTQSAAELDKLSASSTRAGASATAFAGKTKEVATATSMMNAGLGPSSGLFTALGGAIGGAVLAIGAFVAASMGISAFVNATVEAEHQQAQLAAALKSTNGVSGQTLKSLEDYAKQLQRNTNFEDDAIAKSQALLLTFTKIGGDVFPRATSAIADLATRMGGDLQGATIQVGKALNNPIQGITALSRAGIQFTEDQKEMIKGFVESNQIIKAQEVILAELTNQFGGSAEAARNTLGGAIQSLGNAFGNLLEVSGPAVESLRKAIEGLIDAMDNDAFRDFANTIGTVLFTSLELAVKGFTLLVNNISEFWAYAGPTIKEFSGLIYELGSIVIPAMSDAFTAVWDVVKPIIQYFLEGWQQVYQVVKDILGIQDQVKVPATPAATPATTSTATAAADAVEDGIADGFKAGADTTSTAIQKSSAVAANTTAEKTLSTAEQASAIGSAALDNSFGMGADKVSEAASDGGGVIGAQIAANAQIMAAKFEGTGRNIYDLWNNWGNEFINSFGVTIGDLLIQFQRAQTAQLAAQAELFEAQAWLTNEQAKYLRDHGEMPGTAGSGGTGGGSDSSSDGGGSIGIGGTSGISTDSGIGGSPGGKKRGGSSGGMINTDTTDKTKNKHVTLDERGNIALSIINQSNPKDTLDNINTSKGHRTILNIFSSNRTAARAILGVV